ncbi:MAG: MBL fold metallo-hydrolase [Firmicutes bacterium]|nr:MBL fold metallo-hydrolase [Bacillota bacterium]
MVTHIVGCTYYLPGAVNIGIYLHPEGGSTVIDTGLDDGSARKLLRALKELDALPLVNIINTHSHADHCGGNAFLQKRTQASMWATALEAAVIENPYFEPFYLFGGDPLPALRNKFLMAAPSRVDCVLEDARDELAPLEPILLPGHSPGQIGVLTPDGVFFCADAFFPKDTLEKYYLPYYAQVEAALATLKKLSTISATYYLPGHGELTTDISSLLVANEERLQSVSQYILSLLAEPASREELLARIMRDKDIPQNPNQYFLTCAALSAHLTYLMKNNAAMTSFQNGTLIWSQA